MRRALPLVLAALMAVPATPASADGIYFTESFGGANIKDELGERIDSAFKLRVSVGVRRRRWAVELWGGGYLAEQQGPGSLGKPGCAGCEGRDYYAYSTASLGAYGLDLKYIETLSRHFEVYLRGGPSAAIVDGAGLDGYAGRGLGFGAGAQLKGKVRALGFLWWPLFFTGVGPKVTASLWADAGYDFYRLHRGGKLEAVPAIDAKVTSMSIGFAVGSDF
jgi:hypothetical protein